MVHIQPHDNASDIHTLLAASLNLEYPSQVAVAVVEEGAVAICIDK